MQALQAEIDRVARSDAKVLITGESGVGKEIVSRSIHYGSPRATMTFAPVNCAGLPETLLESELFGHVKGSFTGAYRDKPGKLESAHMGTVFLDEIGEMTLRMQGLLAALPRDRRDSARRRRRRRPPRQRPHHRRDAPQPARHDHAGHVPRRPLLPAERHPDHCAAAARAPRRHPGAGHALPAASSSPPTARRSPACRPRR